MSSRVRAAAAIVAAVLAVALRCSAETGQAQDMATNRTYDLTDIAQWAIYSDGVILTFATNGLAEASAYTIERIHASGETTNIVRALVQSGDVCAVYGHQWLDGCGMNGCLVIHYEPMRHCAMCGKTETRQIGDWK